MTSLLKRAIRSGLALLCLAGLQVSQAQEAQVKLRVVGGLAGLNQFTRHEAPFWTSELSRLSGGRYSAEIVPFDRAGMRGPELLSMVKLGTVPFGTLLVSLSSPRDAELAAPDLAGLNPDMSTLRRTVTAFRPRLQALLRERHGAELLAVYVYPAQVLFCNAPLASLADVRGRKVRTSSITQADWVEALGGKALNVPFAEVVANVRAGNVDCAITGTMSGNTIGLHEATTHLHSMAISWGMSVFVANSATWQTLPGELRNLLQRELPKLEAAIWDEAARETEEGIACNAGDSRCTSGKPGRMMAVRPNKADEALRRDILTKTVLPHWLDRCGPACASSWNQLMAPVLGIETRSR